MRKLFCFVFLSLMATGAFAASPLDRSSYEIRDIVMSPQLRRLLPPSEALLDIRRLDRGYLISTRRYQLFVEVVYGGPYGAQGAEEGTPTLNFGELKEK
jgi:hypothetical protein